MLRDTEDIYILLPEMPQRSQPKRFKPKSN